MGIATRIALSTGLLSTDGTWGALWLDHRRSPMKKLTTIDSERLATVTGGFTCSITINGEDVAASPQASAPAATPGAGDGAAGSGGFIAGLRQFFVFLQSPMFSQLVSGAQQMVDASGQPAGAGAGSTAQAAAAPKPGAGAAPQQA